MLIALGLLACSTAEEPDPIPSCEDRGAVTAAASAPDRRLLGLAHEYPGDGMLAARWDELRSSQRARRAMAWEVIERVVAPVAIAEPTVVPDANVPRFRTWYDSEDFTRIFQSAFESLDPAERAARARIEDGAIGAALDANLHVLDSIPVWTDERWAEYVAGVEDREELHAVGGIRRIAISPDAARHVVRSYPEILRCTLEGSPPAFVDGTPAERTLVREPISLGECAVYVAGPYWVASGGRLEAQLEGEPDGFAGATVRIRRGALPEPADVCTAPAAEGCAVDGPGEVYVDVAAAGRSVSGTLVVSYAAPDVDFAGCLDGAFPLASATVAQHWQRVELGPMPTFDTSPEAITAHLGGDATWGEGDGTADPGPGEIFTLRVPAGGTFRLAGMHIRTRELEHWVNITMWWTPDPAGTFGADRPASLEALGPWAHYAMCVSIEDLERDPDPDGGFAGDHPTLAAALRAVHAEPTSWCSNPYIDAAPGLVRSNCVGCHQHAMSGVAPGEVVMDETRYPLSGRVFVRNNFPGDQFWGLDAGDDLAAVIANTVSYWDSAAP